MNAHREGIRTAAAPVGRWLRSGLPPVAALALLAWPAAPVAGQEADRMWAAQTGPNQVTLAWDSVPGAYEYRIYAGAPETLTGNLRARPSLGWLSASGRSAIVSGMQRLSNNDLTLVATDRNGRVLRKRRFNRVQRATTAAAIQPPEEVTAVASATEVTVTWTPVPGATAYYIGRAVRPDGLSTLCALCSTEPRYVDRDVTPGAVTTYTVSAIFPTGISQRVASIPVTPGASQLAATADGKPIAQPVDGQIDGGGGAPTTPYTGGGTPTACPQPITSPKPSPVLAADMTKSIAQPVDGQIDGGGGGTAGGTTGTGCPQPTGGTSMPTTGGQVLTTSGGQVHTATPVDTSTAQPATNPVGGVLDQIGSTIGNLFTGGVAAPTGITAVATGPGAVRVTWSASITEGVTGYRVSRIANGGWQQLNDVGATTLAYTDAFFPTTLFAAGPAQVTYTVATVKGTAVSGAQSNKVAVQPPAPTTATPATGTAACKLDYQRADNMWAAFGRPDGFLGTESISLAGGQDKVFVTDWKYEKTRNDGANFYGSHLRIATNGSARTVRMQIRTATLAGTSTSWTRLEPGKTQQFQADLMEVYCEP